MVNPGLTQFPQPGFNSVACPCEKGLVLCCLLHCSPSVWLLVRFPPCSSVECLWRVWELCSDARAHRSHFGYCVLGRRRVRAAILLAHMHWYIVHIGFIYSNSSSMLYNDTTAFGWWDWVRMNPQGSATDGTSAVIPNCLFIADTGQYQHLIQHLIWRTKDITYFVENLMNENDSNAIHKLTLFIIFSPPSLDCNFDAVSLYWVYRVQ